MFVLRTVLKKPFFLNGNKLLENGIKVLCTLKSNCVEIIVA